MTESKKLSVCIYNIQDASYQRAECFSASITRLEKALSGRVTIVDVAVDAYGLCIQTSSPQESMALKEFIEDQERARAAARAAKQNS